MFVVPGLGSTCWDLASLGENDRDFYIWGAMGGVAMIGLGLALAQPDKRVAVITGDGEMLMGLGSLATIGVKKPPNLAIIVFDNGVYGETGMQPSHTSSGVDLVATARACGIRDLPRCRAARPSLTRWPASSPRMTACCSRACRSRPEEPPRVLPERDGVVHQAAIPPRDWGRAIRLSARFCRGGQPKIEPL